MTNFEVQWKRRHRLLEFFVVVVENRVNKFLEIEMETGLLR